MFERFAHVRPVCLAVAGVAVAILGSWAPAPTVSAPALGLINGLAGLIIYGYPLWVVFGAPLPEIRGARITAVVGIVGIITALVLTAILGTPSLDGPSVWRPITAAMAAISVCLPQVAATTVLRRAELDVGRDLSLGWLSAFLWFLLSFIGWYALHRRLQIAAGIEP